MAIETIGARIYEFRRKKRWSMRQLAQESGIHYVAIFRIEHSMIDPTYSRIEKLAQAFGIAPSTLIPPQKKIKSLSNGHKENIIV
jgi:transcriptional regulator with XRE-family HTH domain